MDQIQMTPQAAIAATTVQSAERVTSFLRKVYGWMCVGLAITATVALGVASSPTLVQAIFGNKILFFGLFAVEIGLVFYLSARISRIAAGTAAGLFLLYSALNGATLSLILLRYTGTSIASTFLVTAGMFGALALFGTATKRSLAGVGQFAFMGLIGIILASLVGMFWKSEGLQFGISIVGVIVFTGLTAWDAQKLKTMAVTVPESSYGSYSVVGALALYLDFINLFLFMLRFMGGRRD